MFMSNRNLASITSNPLFIRVDESIVILFPIIQLGCFKASSFVTFLRKSKFLPLNGPPEAVKISFSIDSLFSPCKH